MQGRQAARVLSLRPCSSCMRERGARLEEAHRVQTATPPLPGLQTAFGLTSRGLALLPPLPLPCPAGMCAAAATCNWPRHRGPWTHICAGARSLCMMRKGAVSSFPMHSVMCGHTTLRRSTFCAPSLCHEHHLCVCICVCVCCLTCPPLPTMWFGEGFALALCRQTASSPLRAAWVALLTACAPSPSIPPAPHVLCNQQPLGVLRW